MDYLKIVLVGVVSVMLMAVGMVALTLIGDHEDEVYECPYCHQHLVREELIKVNFGCSCVYYCPECNADGHQVMVLVR